SERHRRSGALSVALRLLQSRRVPDTPGVEALDDDPVEDVLVEAAQHRDERLDLANRAPLQIEAWREPVNRGDADVMHFVAEELHLRAVDVAREVVRRVLVVDPQGDLVRLPLGTLLDVA